MKFCAPKPVISSQLLMHKHKHHRRKNHLSKAFSEQRPIIAQKERKIDKKDYFFIWNYAQIKLFKLMKEVFFSTESMNPLNENHQRSFYLHKIKVQLRNFFIFMQTSIKVSKCAFHNFHCELTSIIRLKCLPILLLTVRNKRNFGINE